MKICIKTFLLLIFLNTSLFSQEDGQLGDSSSFDFWIGKWAVSWVNADGSIGSGINHVYKILNNNVIFENFKVLDDSTMKGFEGKSHSVYNKITGQWKQTWVDNAGTYLDFTGEVYHDKKVFKREFINSKGMNIIQRMVFYNFKENSFVWDWEVSMDEGKTWSLQWRIKYNRIVK